MFLFEQDRVPLAPGGARRYLILNSSLLHLRSEPYAAVVRLALAHAKDSLDCVPQSDRLQATLTDNLGAQPYELTA